MLTSVTKLRRILVKQIGWAILMVAKPFGTVNAILLKLSKCITDWNDK
tara:strand:- start:397 stop:540 length:144 start_codon:yes stop_codon:yes gene_type:complete